MRRVAPLFTVLLLAGLLPLTLASGPNPPPESQAVSAGGVAVAHWVGTMDAVDAEVEADATGPLWLAMQRAVEDAAGPGADNDSAVEQNRTVDNASVAQRAYVNLTSDTLAFATPNLVLALDPRMSSTWAFADTAFTSNLTEAGPASYNFTVEVYREDADGNATLLGTATGGGAVQVASVVVDQPPVGLPTSYLVAGGAAVVVGGAAALYAMRQRRERRIMNQAPRRSQVMREMELERELEKVQEKEPERAAEIKEEIRAQEVVREKRRELQILEAKRADVLKTMDLLRKRHETGGLTKHQYDNMVAKKQQDLTRIEAEIAQMEAEDAASGAAA